MTAPAAEGRRMMAAAMTEAELQAWVTTSARMLGWLAYHTHDSRHSEAGFPDCVLVRPPRMIVAELKSMKGKVTAGQQLWLDAFKALALPGVQVHVWRPDQLDDILEVLRATE